MNGKKFRRLLALAALVVFAYPLIGNLLIVTGVAHALVNLKPEKIQMSWDSAWTLIPGRFSVSGLEFASTTPRNHFALKVDRGEVALSLLGFLTKTVDITHGTARGVEVRYAKVTQTESVSDPSLANSTTQHTVEIAQSQSTPDTSGATGKAPWTIQLDRINATEIRKVTIENLTGVEDLEFFGNGRLDDLKMSLVTKGGLMQVDRAIGEMVIQSQTGARTELNPLSIRADLRISSHRPREYRGREKLQFFSGTVEAKGNFASLGVLEFLPESELNLQVGGEGNIDAFVILEDGEFRSGSRLKFDSDGIETRFLNFAAKGHGELNATVDADRQQAVDIRIALDRFELSELNGGPAYLTGRDLEVIAQGPRLYAQRRNIDAQTDFSFDIGEGWINDITHYNKFIGPASGVRFLSGSARTRGGLVVDNGIASGLIEISGQNVTLSARDREIEADFNLKANLSEGAWATRTFRLRESSLRLDNVQIASKARETDEDWWGELTVDRGLLVWKQPFDIDGKMTLAMRDIEPLIAMFRDPAKKETKIDQLLNVKDVQGRLLAQSRDGEFRIDPLHIDSDDLEVISRLSMSSETVDGLLYAKFKKIAATLEIVDKKPRIVSFGGRKQILKQIDLSRLDP